MRLNFVNSEKNKRTPSNESEPITQITGFDKVITSIKRLEQSKKSDVVGILAKGIFLSLFSEFDSFMEKLLVAIYSKKPVLFNHLNGSMMISEMLNYETLEDIKAIILQNEIDALRRESYVKQFKTLENRFNIKLTEFSRWPEFVECTQRRNLLAHCDGVVNSQYLKICLDEGYIFTEKVESGDRLELTRKYFLDTCTLMMEVALKLGQVLWRKIFPDELEQADDHLNAVMYYFLTRDNWQLVQIFGEFAESLPRTSNEAIKRMLLVNYAIALKFDGKDKEAKQLLNSLDWSATSRDFRLAAAVLQDDYENASRLMIKIGKKGVYVKEYAYHSWPLFKHFRETTFFTEAYEKVYGYPFASRLQEVAQVAEAEAEENISLAAQEVEDDDITDIFKESATENM